MVARTTPWPAGAPCWVDLGSTDVARAKAFYGSLFGWELQEGPPEAGGYVMCEIGGDPVAGIGPKLGPPEVPDVWLTYLAAPDADEIAAKIIAAGGHVLAEPFDVMEAGRMAVAADPAGAVFGLWQPREHPGMRAYAMAGAVCWSENLSRDFDGNKAFYHAVFGCEFDDMSGEAFSYATFRGNGTPLAGIGDPGDSSPDDMPAHWMNYFGVTDVDATVAKITELGGTVIRPAWDTQEGRMAIVGDDQGAVFAVMTVASAASPQEEESEAEGEPQAEEPGVAG